MSQEIHVASDDLAVTITIDNNKVQNLSFSGNNADALILNTLIEHCKGYSLRECAEHAAIYVVADALRSTPRTPSQGIDSVNMLPPALEQAQNLLRTALNEHLPKEGWNFEDRGLSETWMAQGQEKQRHLILAQQNQYLQQKGHEKDILELVEIDIHGRLFYTFKEGVSPAIKPGLLMGLEHYLQEELQERIEVFLTEMKDQHKLRRL